MQSFSRLNKTYRSLREKSTNLVQKVVETSNGKTKDESETSNKAKVNKPNPRDSMPPLTISESRRNIGECTKEHF